MNLQMPTGFHELHYNEDLIIRIAGPSSEISSFLNLDPVDRDKPSLFLETVDEEGQWQPVEPVPTFSRELDDLAKEIRDTPQPRGSESEIWIPEGFDMFWAEVLAQFDAPVTPRAIAKPFIEDNDIVRLFREQHPLSIQLVPGVPNTRLTIPDKEMAPGKLHFLAFSVVGRSYVDVRAYPIDQVQIFIGPTEPVGLTCSTNQLPLGEWKGSGEKYYRCELPKEPLHYGAVLFNRDPSRACTYSLKGACGTNETTIT